MSRNLKVALSIFVPSAVVALVNAWAFRAFPARWGGPNIGGGAIQLLAYIGLIVSIVFLVLAFVERRRERSRQ